MLLVYFLCDGQDVIPYFLSLRTDGDSPTLESHPAMHFIIPLVEMQLDFGRAPDGAGQRGLFGPILKTEKSPTSLPTGKEVGDFVGLIFLLQK